MARLGRIWARVATLREQASLVEAQLEHLDTLLGEHNGTKEGK